MDKILVSREQYDGMRVQLWCAWLQSSGSWDDLTTDAAWALVDAWLARGGYTAAPEQEAKHESVVFNEGWNAGFAEAVENNARDAALRSEVTRLRGVLQRYVDWYRGELIDSQQKIFEDARSILAGTAPSPASPVVGVEHLDWALATIKRCQGVLAEALERHPSDNESAINRLLNVLGHCEELPKQRAAESALAAAKGLDPEEVR